ncbi:MAG: hypothetical protein E6H06_12485 [Bacteroidetes bacterium]|nr:MAG: hypothetical protein E6H06_12485 [Bacteroidota bacterium]
MRKINQRSGWFLICLLLVYFLSACKKEKATHTDTYTPVPFLTDRTWKSDTMIVNPPLTYNQLSTTDQVSYQHALDWFKAELTFNEDGTVTCSGDWDFGYKTWRLVNNNSDIEVSDYFGKKYILRSWVADAVHLSYVIQLNNSFDCSLIYR